MMILTVFTVMNTTYRVAPWNRRRWGRLLTSPLELDSMLSAINPFLGGALRGRIVSIQPQTSSAASIRFETNRKLPTSRAGQFVTVGVDVRGVRHHRCFSLTSTPSDDDIEITVQAVEGGTVSSHLVHRARVGDIVQLAEPAGDFVLPNELTPMLCVSGGSGITPVMAMLRDLDRRTDHGGRRDVVVVHYVPTRSRLLFADELAGLTRRSSWLQLELVVTDEGGQHLGIDHISALCPDWRDRETFVCGPASLRNGAMDLWQSEGDATRLHIESFTAIGIAPRPVTGGVDDGLAGPTAMVSLSRSGIELVADSGMTLLDALEAHGLTPPSGCRMGICHTCVTPLKAGCVNDLRDGRIIDAGTHVQLCVTTPNHNITLDI